MHVVHMNVMKRPKSNLTMSFWGALALTTSSIFLLALTEDFIEQQSLKWEDRK